MFVTIWNIISKYGLWLIIGTAITLLVALLGTLIGLLIGLLIGVFRTMPKPKNKFLNGLKKTGEWILNAYVEVFRGTPMMVQSMIIYYGFAKIAHYKMDVIVAGLLIVSINTGAYMAEIVRGGIISIDKGQFEGAQAIGMTHFQTMFHVVLPQALRNILPSVANEFVINIKDTSVLNVIAFTDLYYYANSIYSNNRDVVTWIFVAVIYFILTFAITRLLRLLEKKMDGNKNYTVFGSQSDPQAEIHVKEGE